MEVRVPLVFAPVYQPLVWGGRRLTKWGRSLPPGPIGEAWELADHDRGMSVVAQGPLAGRRLRELVTSAGAALVGGGFAGGEFPLMVKLIDASLRLSVQVHPDAALARKLGVGGHGKSECWVFLEDGGEVYQGTRPGIDRQTFERALGECLVQDTLNRFTARKGDVFFLPARTVHALGEGCLLYEVQQTSDVTFRVYDWDRMGLDGKPRVLHVAECLETIDFSPREFGPQRQRPWQALGGLGRERELVSCPHFVVREQWIEGRLAQSSQGRCLVVTCLAGHGQLATPAGQVTLSPLATVLVPADAATWTVTAPVPVNLLLATPCFG
ncbi:MAG: type I phosphomannose isomerase catalytic subunit [Polyangia bacterium]